MGALSSGVTCLTFGKQNSTLVNGIKRSSVKQNSKGCIIGRSFHARGAGGGRGGVHGAGRDYSGARAHGRRGRVEDTGHGRPLRVEPWGRREQTAEEPTRRPRRAILRAQPRPPALRGAALCAAAPTRGNTPSRPPCPDPFRKKQNLCRIPGGRVRTQAQATGSGKRPTKA